MAMGGPTFGHPSIVAGGKGTKPPDTRYQLYYNATIWTGEEQGGDFADALLVREGGVVAVGALAEVRRALLAAVAAPETVPGGAAAEEVTVTDGAEVVEYDMGGSFLMPGFVDAHVHLVPAGLSLARVDLRGAASRTAFQQRVGELAGRLGPGEWVLGGQWDEGEWGGEMPTAEWLDEVCGGRPAYLTRHDLHMALANTAALQLAGVGPSSADLEGGIIDRQAGTGRPTGLLRERAMGLVESVIPAPSAAERGAALAAASRHALSRGVTTLVDMGRYLAGDTSGPWQDLQDVYMPAADSGELRVRVSAMMPLSSWRRLAAWVSAHGRAHPGGRLFWGGLKEFADGSLGSRTALLWERYSDVGSEGPAGAAEAIASGGGGGTPCCGQRGISDAELRELAAAAVRAGLQVAIHAIGDRAVDEVVAAYRDVLQAAVTGKQEREQEQEQEGGPGGDERAEQRARRRLGHRLRLRVEHVQHLSGSGNASAALARNGLTTVPNPLHLLTDAPMLLPRLGPVRAARAFALASLRAAGLRPALASDWPVVDLQPLTGVYAAVHRHAPPPDVVAAMVARLPRSGAAGFQVVGASGPDHDGGGGGSATPWAPEEALPLRDALLGHTAWGAAAAGLEDYVGRLAPGLRADFVQLSDSLAEELEEVEGEEGAENEEGEGKGSGGRLRLSEARLWGCLPVVVRTWLDGELVYDIMGAVDGGLAGEPVGEGGKAEGTEA